MKTFLRNNQLERTIETKQNENRRATESNKKTQNNCFESTSQFKDNRHSFIKQKELISKFNRPNNNVQFAKTNAGDEIPEFLYHGTSEEAATKIESSTLGESRISKKIYGSVRVSPTVWLATTKEKAVGRFQKVIFKVRTSGLNSASFTLMNNGTWTYKGTIPHGNLTRISIIY